MLRIGGLALNVLFDYTKSSLSGTGGGVTDDEDEGNKNIESNYLRLRSIRGSLEKYGGVFSKIAQMISYSDPEYTTSYDECKPFSRDKTHDWFMSYTEDATKPSVKYTVDKKIHKSGSVGQVYKGFYNNDSIAIKVLYRGLKESTQSDLDALETLSNFMYGFMDLENGIKEVSAKVKEELDYKNELKNTQKIYNLWKDDKVIVIPKTFEDICDSDILVTQFIEGVSVTEFLKTATQEDKNWLGSNIIRFIFTNLYMWGIFYSDSHYGNIIITKDRRIAFIDFGCLHFVNEVMRVNLVRLHRAIIINDRELIKRYLFDLGILVTGETSNESIEFAIDYFIIQYRPWTTPTSFVFNSEWIEISVKKNPKMMKEWKLPKGMVYFNKIPWGLTHVLANMKCEGDFTEIFSEII